jgi:hypothetical protein
MSDQRPVYLIPYHEYVGNYSVEGEGVPPDGVTLQNGCNIRAKIDYVFTGPNGEPIVEDQILSENWKEEWSIELTVMDCGCCAKRSDIYKIQKNILKYLEEKYPDNTHPETMGELNELWWKLYDD